jgi:four helix bundle protein
MTYERFEDLPVWQAAVELAEMCEDLLDGAGEVIRRGRQDQLDRCSLSVSNNIAEGFERGTTNELIYFLYVARGSAGETRSMMRVFARRARLRPWGELIERITVKAESCSRQLRAWSESLQNSDIKGQRHLNDESRVSYEKGKGRKESEARIRAMDQMVYDRLPEGHPLRAEMKRKGQV